MVRTNGRRFGKSKIIHFWHIKDFYLIKMEQIFKMGPIWGWGEWTKSAFCTGELTITDLTGFSCCNLVKYLV